MTADKMNSEIRLAEQWLRRKLPPGETISTEHVKLRIRLELGEQWLAERLTEPANEEMAARLRRTLQSALGCAPAPRFTQPAWRLFAGSCAAAAAGVAILVWTSAARKRTDSELPTVSAFESMPLEDDFDAALGEIEDALGNLHDALANRDEVDWYEDAAGM